MERTTDDDPKAGGATGVEMKKSDAESCDVARDQEGSPMYDAHCRGWGLNRKYMEPRDKSAARTAAMSREMRHENERKSDGGGQRVIPKCNVPDSRAGGGRK